MTVEEMKDVIVYLQSRVQELESKKYCECADEEVAGPTNATVTYKTTPRQVFVTNYDEDDECLTCSA
jgi:hypothetical protein